MKSHFIAALVLKLEDHKAHLERNARTAAFSSVVEEEKFGKVSKAVRSISAIDELIPTILDIVESLTTENVLSLAKQTNSELTKRQEKLRTDIEDAVLEAARPTTGEKSRKALLELALDNRTLHDEVGNAMRLVDDVVADFRNGSLTLSRG